MSTPGTSSPPRRARPGRDWTGTGRGAFHQGCPLNSQLNLWSLGLTVNDYTPVYFGRPDLPGTTVVLMPSWTAAQVVGEHNAEVEAARAHRPTVDVEAMLTRVLTAALRELLRGLRPRWWRRLRRAH